MPGATVGLHAEDPTIAEMLKPLGYATGQFGKNHLGDRDEYLPTMHGFDEFFGNLYHLNAEEEPELPDYPKDPEFKKKFGPRGVLHCVADGKGGQKVTDTGPLTKKRMETVDEEITARALTWMEKQVKAEQPFFLWYNSTAMHFRTHLADKNRGKSGQDALISFTLASRSAACLAASVTRASLTSNSVAIFFAFKTSIDFSSAAAFSSATRADSISARADSSAASNGGFSSSTSTAPD